MMLICTTQKQYEAEAQIQTLVAEVGVALVYLRPWGEELSMLIPTRVEIVRGGGGGPENIGGGGGGAKKVR